MMKHKTNKPNNEKIFLIHSKDNGKPVWHYILVPKENIKLLRQQKAGADIDVTDFGKIIKSGWGDNPSPETIQIMEEDYGDLL